MRGFTSGNSTRSCTLTISTGRSILRAAPQQEHGSGRCSTTSSGVSLATRLWPSCPGLAPPGLDFSRCSLRSVEGGLEDVREVFCGRCSRSTSSISSSLLRRSRSLRPMTTRNQRNPARARAWVITFPAHGLFRDWEAVLAPDPRDQFHQPPAHHSVHRRNGTALDQLDQVLAMAVGEPGGLAGRLAVDEPLGALGVELEHPIAHDLQRHAPDPRRLGAGGSFVDRRQREKPTSLGSILCLPGQSTKPRCIEVRTEWDRHGEPPWLAKLNHTHPDAGNHERVSPSGTWYYPQHR